MTDGLEQRQPEWLAGQELARAAALLAGQREILPFRDLADWLISFPELNPYPVIELDLSTASVSYANPAARRLFPGVEREGLRHPWLAGVAGLFEGLRISGTPVARRDVEIDGACYEQSLSLVPGRERLRVYAIEITDKLRTEKALRAALDRYRSFLEVTGQVGWTTNAAGEVVEDLPAWRRFTGQTLEEIQGWGWSAALHPDDRETAARVWTDSVKTRTSYEIEYRMRRHDGVYRNFLARGTPTLSADGSVREWVGTCVDITEHKRAEDYLAVSLREKDVLLREIHHRVKNNLQIVSSLVSLQIDGLDDAAARLKLEGLRDRVRSMALVHEKLYESTDLACLDFAQYAQALLEHLWSAHGADSARVQLELALESVPLPVDAAMPCGLLLNELVSNALKHAFPHRSDGVVSVSLCLAKDGRVCLRVRDNGVGLPPGLDWGEVRSLGLRLVRMLAKQLGGTLEVRTGAGTEFELAFGEVRSAP